MSELLAWLDAQSAQAAEAMKAARGTGKGHAIFHASAVSRYVALQQAREHLARTGDGR